MHAEHEDLEPSARKSTLLGRAVIYGFGAAGIALCINQNLNLGLLGTVLVDNTFIYLQMCLFLSVTFLIYPMNRRTRGPAPLYDWCLFALCAAVCGFLAWHGSDISERGWTLQAPPIVTAASTLLCLFALEAVRRAGGNSMFIVCAVFAVFPVVAYLLPGFLWSPQMNLDLVIREHALGTESILGQPIRVVTEVLMGFLIFGAALVVTGGGQFFMDLAMALLGKTRGGTAKVCIMSSALFGSLSGSVLSNIVTTGRLTIPAMKRAGYSPTYAAAVESCASTGGVMMPPVMGAVAFIMADFLRISYADVAIAATVPSLLYYLALMVQVDLHARKMNLSGQVTEETPKLLAVFARGWHHLAALVLLTYLLVWMRDETYAPYYATAFVVLTALIRRQIRIADLVSLLRESALTIVGIFAILTGIGMIIGALTFTGVGTGFARELLLLANENVYVILLLGAVTSFILGIGLTVTACYLLLATILPPPLVQLGLDPIAVHMFILYWGVLSFITPPVAAGSMAAAGIAGAKPMAVDMLSMRIGTILFILPFMFVLNPALILKGSSVDIAHSVGAAVVSVFLISCALEGWLYGIGRIGTLARTAVMVAGIMLMLPGEHIAVINAELTGAILALATIIAIWIGKRLRHDTAPETKPDKSS